MIMQFRKSNYIIVFLGYILTIGTVNAKDLNSVQLNIIKGTAADICNTISTAKGQKTEAQIAGDVKAKLGGLAGKLADVGLDGTASSRREAFEGLSQEATGDALQGDRGCRERLFNKMFDVARDTDGKNPVATSLPANAASSPGLTSTSADRSLVGEWAGSIVCKDGRTFLVTITIDKQVGDTGSGNVEWSGYGSGKAKVRISAAPNSQEPLSYVYITDRPDTYSYNLKRLTGNKFIGLSMGIEKCEISIER